jgi:hypothetical protein
MTYLARLAAEAAVEKRMRETFFVLGVDPTDGESVERFRLNMHFLTEMREGREARVKGMWKAIIEDWIARIISGLIGAGAAIASVLWQHWDKK